MHTSANSGITGKHRNGSYLAGKLLGILAASAGLVMAAGTVQAATPQNQVLVVYAAGTLATPFKRVDKAFEKLHPGVTIQPQFGGSVMMARRITQLHQKADVYAAADYSVIPKIMGKAGLSKWYVGFASNAATLAYTPKSRGAKEINATNWYKVVSRPGVVIGRSDPNTDPSGYQFLQMLSLANDYYKKPDLKRDVLKNAPKSAVRNTETSLISALQLGDIDYLAIYESSAIAHHLKYVQLPASINLSDPSKGDIYAKGTAKTTKGVLHGRPIIYAATIPTSAEHPQLAAEYVAFLTSKQGQDLIASAGLTRVQPAVLAHGSAAPASLRSITKPWPKDVK